MWSHNVWFLPRITLPSNQNGPFMPIYSSPNSRSDRRFVTCFTPTTHMVAAHRRHLHDMHGHILLTTFMLSPLTLTAFTPPLSLRTSNYSFTSIPFLDVNLFVDNGNITTDLYTKATDKHQHLLHSSCHPQHAKRAIPFSLALWLRRICSSDETFKQRSDELKSYLNKRGYV